MRAFRPEFINSIDEISYSTRQSRKHENDHRIQVKKREADRRTQVVVTLTDAARHGCSGGTTRYRSAPLKRAIQRHPRPLAMRVLEASSAKAITAGRRWTEGEYVRETARRLSSALKE